MKLSQLANMYNLKEQYNSSEGAARGAVAAWLKKGDEKIYKLHSFLTTQYVIQFATLRLVKPDSNIHKEEYSEIKKMLSKISIDNIRSIDHEAKHLAITASKLLLREKYEGTASIIWMIDQIESISNLPAKDARKLLPEISDWLDIEISKCQARIRKTVVRDESYQEELFTKDAKEAGKDGIPSGKRNVVKK